MMEKTSKVNKPIELLGIKSVKEADDIEKKIVRVLENLEEGVEEDPEAHERLLKLGKKISEESDVKGKAVEEFLKERKIDRR
ncbi:MAG: hypothetical protein ACOC1V_04895 [Candidatus Saliniplasma sp.]